MEMGHLNPASLPSGTLIGPWRVEAPLGWGACGVVYRAVAAEHGSTASVALKVALYPWDKRFARETELLSRLRHPAVPRLLDHGQWESPPGVPYAWLVMEWVDGTPLYDWARAQRPTSPLRPEARGSAREVAEALEQAARKAGPEADVPLFTGEEPRPAGLFPAPQRVAETPAPSVSRWSRLAAAGVGAYLALGFGMLLGTRPMKERETQPLAEQEEARDGGAVAVGDSALTAPVAPERVPSMWAAIAVDLPPKPLPGQSRPDAYGRCPRRGQVPINGGCWRKVEITDMQDCDEDAYVYKGACYAPMFPPPRPATSGPAEPADGG